MGINKGKHVYEKGAHRFKKVPITPISTPTTNESPMSFGNVVAVGRRAVGGFSDVDVSGASKEILVTGSWSSISSVGNRRMTLLQNKWVGIPEVERNFTYFLY
jgi:hypothetical protein